jgi:hypothetical protein
MDGTLGVSPAKLSRRAREASAFVHRGALHVPATGVASPRDGGFRESFFTRM